MKAKLIIMILYFFIAASLVFGAQAQDTTRRFGIFIGANNGGRERVTLRFAVTDATSIRDVFLEMGGIANEDSVLLVEPNIREINRHLDIMREQILLTKGANRRTEIIFYYSGHADEEGLLLNREKYSYRELRDRINNIPADMRIVILDSCASGAFTRLKGGQRTLPFLMDTSLAAEGHAFLTSSSANEASQESDRINASFFTHSLVTGLRGAADSVGDGRVTLNELYRFAFSETLARTEATLFGAQHPSYDIQISGSGELVLTDINQTSAGIVFHENLTGRLSIRNRHDHLIVELTKTDRRPLELGLSPGLYSIILQQGNDLFRVEITLVEGRRTLITKENFTGINAEPTRRRGGEYLSFLPQTTLYTFFFNVVHEPFNFPLIGAVNFAIGNHKFLQAGLLNWNTENFSGMQAGVANTTGGDFSGPQLGFLNTTIGNFSGMQAGFINTAISNSTGLQAGFINTNIGETNGMQVGYVNTAVKEISGAQVGFVNVAAKEISGAQVGFINVAAKGIKGFQLGFINYTDNIENGVPIGFLSIVRNGGYRAIEYSFTEFHTYNLGFKIGVDKFYTTIIVAYNQSNEFSWDDFATGAGFGSLLPINRLFFFNPELNFLSPFTSFLSYTSFVPYIGVNLGRFSITAGPSVTWVYSDSNDTEKMLEPLFSFHSFDFDNMQIVFGARAAVRLRF